MRLIIVALLLNSACGHRILAVFPVPARSHDRLAQGIVGALLRAGHEVSWATPYPENKAQPGLTIIDVSETQKLNEGIDPQIVATWPVGRMMAFGRNVSIVAATNSGVRRALKQRYHAVITELFLSDLHAGFAAVLQVPWLVLSVQMLHSGLENMADVRVARREAPTPQGLVPRATDALWAGLTRYRHMSHLTECEKYYQQIFEPIAKARGVMLPPYFTALYNISVLFVNSHPSLAPAVSVPPSVVNIAGYHIEEQNSRLPKDLQELMDSSEDGVVYFSMGSVVQASRLPERLRDELIRALGALPCTVLWKFETPIAQLPGNVHVRAWWPQPAILGDTEGESYIPKRPKRSRRSRRRTSSSSEGERRTTKRNRARVSAGELLKIISALQGVQTHPNTKVFVTHGGLLSTLEAMKAGVPLLAVPVYDDQPGNARRAERAGWALTVPFSLHMVDDFEVALDKMLNNNSYYNKAKFLSKVFNDRQVPPAQLITHYLECAIETKGASYLHPHTSQYKWYERYMLDQLAVVLLTLSLFWNLFNVVLKRALKLLFGRKGACKGIQKT